MALMNLKAVQAYLSTCWYHMTNSLNLAKWLSIPPGKAEGIMEMSPTICPSLYASIILCPEHNPVLQIRRGKRDNLGIISLYNSFKPYVVTRH